jgi:hypothetical protein
MTTTTLDELQAMHRHLQGIIGNLKPHLDAGELTDIWFRDAEAAIGSMADDFQLDDWDHLPGAPLPGNPAARALVRSCTRILGQIRLAAVSMSDPDTAPSATTTDEFMKFMAELMRR